MILKMVHIPGGDWNPGQGDNPNYITNPNNAPPRGIPQYWIKIYPATWQKFTTLFLKPWESLDPAKKRGLDVFFAGAVWISSPHQCWDPMILREGDFHGDPLSAFFDMGIGKRTTNSIGHILRKGGMFCCFVGFVFCFFFMLWFPNCFGGGRMVVKEATRDCYSIHLPESSKHFVCLLTVFAQK